MKAPIPGQPLEIGVLRVLAFFCGIGSILFGGIIAALSAIDAPNGDPWAGVGCIGLIAMLPFLTGVLLWQRKRLWFFLSLYCFGLAAMSLIYLLLFTAPILSPELANSLRPENQRWLKEINVRWTPPIAIITLLLVFGIAMWFADRHEARDR